MRKTYTPQMIIRKAYQFRLKTTSEIESKLDFFAGCCRKLWNMVLERSLHRLSNHQPIFWYNEAAFWLTFWKSSEDYAFLNECHSQVLQQKLRDLDKAFRDAFDKTQPLKRLPTWRKRGRHDSFRFSQGFKIDNRRLYLPKIGWVGFFKSAKIQGNPKNLTIIKKGGHWYCSIQVEQSIEIPTKTRNAIGIDMGVAHFATLSNGEQIESQHAFKTLAKKLASEQRKLAKKIKSSSNWKKQKKRITKCHRKISDVRRDFLHKTSTLLSNNHALIVIEDLKIKNMSKSASGSIESPGTNVNAKSGLNKSILDQGWGEFRRQLEYKLHWSGGMLVAINPKHTSKRCNKCDYTAKENRLTQAHFHCQQCGHCEDADVNAAKNILADGLSVLACGEAALAASEKQEPLRNCEKVVA